ncbi:hypothetical protein LMG28614_05437 [Paraburkholderia ultramafica]|uniref:FimV C-terminal domain-containing protein n=1 Tax=Paraburkholderia ultramafica TaxID=1544867 RepID=A0A6S7BIQ2_9BURK|nr:FimV/HubP family polar landmark protein [Paraburkholderia ultramafica]CAB3801591.1 hypothetical protein LMG28614_05437 [Paraburkholderia ultramafica]
MNLRLSSIRAMFIHQDKGRLTGHAAGAAALALALATAGVGSAIAAPGDAASAPDAASVSYAAGSQYTVRPGQSLNDVAIAVTQSHDRATLVRASRALFDANPNAFMGHDPSRMRVGAVLVVPALDASGALAASSAGAQGAAAASAPSTAVATDAASGVAQVNAAAASAASAAAPVAPAVSGKASAAAEASSAAVGGAAASSALAAGSQAAASPVGGAHEWSGSIQPSASEPAVGGQTPAGTAPATAAVQSASQPRAQVSSLQQLLALKNRVLMELQKHGIGGAPVATSGTVSASAVQPVAGASSAAPAVSGHGAAAVVPASNSGGMSQRDLSIAAAVGAALVVLLAALRMSRRKRERVASAEAASADGEVTASARASDPQDIVAARGQTAVREAPGADDGDAVRHAAALAVAERAAAEQAEAERAAAERAAAEGAEAERTAAERVAAERAEAGRAAAERLAAEQAHAARAAAERAAAEQAAAEQAAAEHAAAEHAAAERARQQAMAERATAEHLPTTHEPHTDSPVPDPNPLQRDWQEHHASPAPFEPVQPAAIAVPPAESDSTSEPRPAAHEENFDGATTAASLAAAAELGAEALPLTPLEPVDEALQPEEPAHRLRWNDEPSPRASAAPQEPATEPQNHLNAPPPVIDFTQQRIEPHTAPPFGQPYRDVSADPLPETSAHAQPASAVPTEFPRDAVDAFGSLDMPLPPRVESLADSIQAPASLTTQPVASPETTAQQAFAPHEPDDAPHVADEIAAGTAGHAAVAGLGAAGLGAASFGALKLDFDLELPPSPAQPLPAFTQADLVRIARNKLDLASEYIELGDLSGARALINEVIEANDPATRTAARALLSTLAPLS